MRGNFSTVTRVLLSRLHDDGKLSYEYDGYVFHTSKANNLTYLVISPAEFPRSVAFAFLREIEARFTSTYGQRAQTAVAFSFQSDFQRVLASQMEYHSNLREHDKMARVQDELGQVKSAMVQNIDKVLQRGERIELLVDKSDALDQNAFRFRKHATHLKRAMWWKNVKMWLIIGLIAIILIYIILAFSCGGLGLPKCKSSSSHHSNHGNGSSKAYGPAGGAFAALTNILDTFD